MHCPQCGTFLNQVTYEGVGIHTCDGCGGEFLGPDELRHIVTTREQRFDDDLHEAMRSRDPMHGIPGDEAQRHLSCPLCAGAMNVVNYSGDTGICIDRCEQCGSVWLDHEELERIQAVMEEWQDAAPAKLPSIARELETTRRETAEGSNRAFSGSRFAFVNAVINRLLDAA